MIDKLIKILQNLKQWWHDHGHCDWQDGPHFAEHRGSRDYAAFRGQECSICHKRQRISISPRLPTPYCDVSKESIAWINEGT